MLRPFKRERKPSRSSINPVLVAAVSSSGVVFYCFAEFGADYKCSDLPQFTAQTESNECVTHVEFDSRRLQECPTQCTVALLHVGDDRCANCQVLNDARP